MSTATMDVYVTIGLTALVLGLMLIFYKHMVFIGFDFEGATVAGIPASKIDYLLLVLLSVVIVVTLQVVGIILVVGMLITPASTSTLITRRFSTVIYVGILFGIVSAVVGLYISYYFNLPSGPSIALTSTIMFTLAFAKKWRTA